MITYRCSGSDLESLKNWLCSGSDPDPESHGCVLCPILTRRHLRRCSRSEPVMHSLKNKRCSGEGAFIYLFLVTMLLYTHSERVFRLRFLFCYLRNSIFWVQLFYFGGSGPFSELSHVCHFCHFVYFHHFYSFLTFPYLNLFLT